MMTSTRHAEDSFPLKANIEKRRQDSYINEVCCSRKTLNIRG
ncbi:hypothetical protein SP21_18 [Salmonella phage 21]|nr:hypothetical protein SP21_18 [Salmonella phage 21]